jgi:hypothetical protein
MPRAASARRPRRPGSPARARSTGGSAAKARSQQITATSPSSVSSAYMRVSCAYWVMNGFVAAITAAIQPVRGPKSSRPPHQASGTQKEANSSESACVASSERPASGSHRCRST